MKILIERSKGVKKNKVDLYFYFTVIARNGECLATSEMYETKQACKKGIAAIRGCLFAKVVDRT